MTSAADGRAATVTPVKRNGETTKHKSSFLTLWPSRPTRDINYLYGRPDVIHETVAAATAAAAPLTSRPVIAQSAEGLNVAVYLDPPTHHLLGDRLFDRECNPYVGEDILAPFAAVHDSLAARGIPVRTADFLPDAPDGRLNIVISYGMSDALASESVRRYRKLARRNDVVLSALFAIECPIVEPTIFQSLPALQSVFRRIMSWSDSASLHRFTRRAVALEHFCLPQSFDAVHEALWLADDRKFMLMMNTNKLPRLYVNELYTARLRAVQYFQQFGEVDLYGRYWDSAPRRVGRTRVPTTLRRGMERAWEIRHRFRPDPLYTPATAAWKGTSRSKSATFAQYRFALCFENSVLKGYITEKLFDCFFAGTVPIYWGAPDILDWVPADSFIDMREFGDFAELRNFLHSLTPAQEARYRESARAYLASDRFEPFRKSTWVELHERIISADIGRALQCSTTRSS